MKKAKKIMNTAEAPRQEVRRQPTYQELRSQTPEQRAQYLDGMVRTIERNYPGMDVAARQSIGLFLRVVTQVIRPSGKEDAMRDVLIGMAENHPQRQQMEYAVDKAGNLLVTIAATPGYEEMPGLLIQSHMDQNCNPTAEQNPELSPAVNPVIPVFKDNETKIATLGTTLGADDGLGLTAALVFGDEFLMGNVPHGKIGLLFTTDEEVGLTGAENFSFPKELLLGYKYYFNFDNEDSHEAIVGAAGGHNLDMRLPLTRDQHADGRRYVAIDLSGLVGGHSGAEIHLGHLNAVKVADSLLQEAVDKLDDARLVSFSAGTTDSAIPQRARVIVAVKLGQEELLQEILTQANASIIEQDAQTKEGLRTNLLVKEKEKKKGKLNHETPIVEVTSVSDTEQKLLPMTRETTQKVLALLADIPTGPLETDEQYSIVKTSTNLGIVGTKTIDGQDVLQVFNLTRSSDPASTERVNRQITQITQSYGASIAPGDKGFFAWEPDFSSPLLQLAREAHLKMTGEPLDITVLHAGLESHTINLKLREILGDDMPDDFQIISVGPSLDGPHSESEYFDIQETAEFYPWTRELLHAVLRQEAEKLGKPFPSEKSPTRRSLAA